MAQKWVGASGTCPTLFNRAKGKLDKSHFNAHKSPPPINKVSGPYYSVACTL